jgi:hypothetical protein
LPRIGCGRAYTNSLGAAPATLIVAIICPITAHFPFEPGSNPDYGPNANLASLATVPGSRQIWGRYMQYADGEGTVVQNGSTVSRGDNPTAQLGPQQPAAARFKPKTTAVQ